MLNKVEGETRPVRLSVLVEGTSVCSQLMVAGDMDGPFSSPTGDMLLVTLQLLLIAVDCSLSDVLSFGCDSL